MSPSFHTLQHFYSFEIYPWREKEASIIYLRKNILECYSEDREVYH